MSEGIHTRSPYKKHPLIEPRTLIKYLQEQSEITTLQLLLNSPPRRASIRNHDIKRRSTGNHGMLRLMGLPHVTHFPEATVTRDDEKMYIRFGGLAEERLMSVPLKYIGAEDEEAAELQLLAQLQKIGYQARRGRPSP